MKAAALERAPAALREGSWTCLPGWCLCRAGAGGRACAPGATTGRAAARWDSGVDGGESCTHRDDSQTGLRVKRAKTEGASTSGTAAGCVAADGEGAWTHDHVPVNRPGFLGPCGARMLGNIVLKGAVVGDHSRLNAKACARVPI